MSGTDHHHRRPAGELGGHRERGDDRGPRGRADQDPLFARDPARHAERVAVRDPHVAVDQRRVERRGPEVLADALGQVRVDVARVDRALGVRTDHEQVRFLLLQVPGGAGDRPAGAHPGHQDVDRAVGLSPDLGAGGLVVGGRVLGVEVLVRLVGARDLLGQAVRDAVVGLGGLGRDGGRADDDLRAVGPQERDLLLAHLVRHHEDAAVPADRRRDRETVSRVAGGRFDDRAAGLQAALAFGRLDHPKADAILDAAARVEHLELGEDGRLDAPGDLVEPDERRVADRVEHRVEYVHSPSEGSGRLILPRTAPPVLPRRRPERPDGTFTRTPDVSIPE